MAEKTPGDFEVFATDVGETAKGNRLKHRAPGRPLTQGSTVLVILIVVGSFCAASAVDYPAFAAGAWLRTAALSLLLLAGLYRVGVWEQRGTIRVTGWLRIGIIGWLVLGAPVATVLQTHFRYVPSPLWSGPTTLLALLAIPLGIAGTVTLSHGQPRWLRGLFVGFYLVGAVFVSALVGLLVAGLHGDAL